jgi:hypothetical protein
VNVDVCARSSGADAERVVVEWVARIFIFHIRRITDISLFTQFLVVFFFFFSF